MFRSYLYLNKSISNEIAIDEHVMGRLKVGRFLFTPVRPAKSSVYLDKIPLKTLFYLFLNIIFLISAPIFFGLQLISILKVKRKINLKKTVFPKLEDTIVLVANSRTVELFKKNITLDKSSAVYIEFDEKKINGVNEDEVSTHILQYISTRQIINCYILAVLYLIGSFPMILRLNLLQYYVSFNWLVKFSALRSIPLSVGQNVYFSNHYDRWAVMFDSVLQHQKLNLIQHGILPQTLYLPYKLANLKYIYTLDLQSQNVFTSLFNLTNNVEFALLKSILSLTKTSYQNSVLIIGQPQSAVYEVEIVQELLNISYIDVIFIKPHPLFYSNIYSKINSPKVQIIKDKLFYPEVSVALNYNSTLGLEYKNAGIPVVEIKDQVKSDIILKVEKLII